VVWLRRLRLKAATMGWFRSNGGRVAGLAFFALACQFVFTFGHVHIGNVGVVRALAIAADAVNDSASVPSSPTRNTPTASRPRFLRGLQQCQLGKHAGLAALSCDSSANIVCSGISMAIGGD
jgi:hypothetical protein